MSPSTIRVADERLATLVALLREDESLPGHSRDVLIDDCERALQITDHEKRTEVINLIRWRYGERGRIKSLLEEHFNQCPVRSQIYKGPDGKLVYPWPCKEELNKASDSSSQGEVRIWKFRFSGTAAIVFSCFAGFGLIFLVLFYIFCFPLVNELKGAQQKAPKSTSPATILPF